MSATVIPLHSYRRRPIAAAQCDAVTWWEAATHRQIRFTAAVWRDWLRAWWGV